MDNLKAIVIIVAVVCLCVAVTSALIQAHIQFLETHKEISVTSEIVDKTERSGSYTTIIYTDDALIPVVHYYHYYYLHLKDGTKHTVSSSTYSQYKVGDTFTYKIWVEK